MKRTFLLTTLLILMVCSVVQAQSLQMSGTIVSKSDGQPVIGATIFIYFKNLGQYDLHYRLERFYGIRKC